MTYTKTQLEVLIHDTISDCNQYYMYRQFNMASYTHTATFMAGRNTKFGIMFQFD